MRALAKLVRRLKGAPGRSKRHGGRVHRVSPSLITTTVPVGATTGVVQGCNTQRHAFGQRALPGAARVRAADLVHAGWNQRGQAPERCVEFEGLASDRRPVADSLAHPRAGGRGDGPRAAGGGNPPPACSFITARIASSTAHPHKTPAEGCILTGSRASKMGIPSYARRDSNR